MNDTQAKTPGRLEWLDGWRGLAVFWMIATHCFNAFRTPSWEQTEWFPWVNYANGLVAPSFLFIAGFGQGLANRKAWERGQGVRLNYARWRRLLGIFLLGFLLQAPELGWLAGQATPWGLFVRWMCAVNILPCVAVALFVLLVTARLCPGPRSFDAVGLVLTVGVVAAAPMVSACRSDHARTQMLLSWANTQYGALFPLLPWLAFASAGAVCSRWQGHVGKLLAAACACGLLARIVPGTDTLTYLARPDFFVERLGWVLALGALFAGWRGLAQTRVLSLIGRHSLKCYVIHLQIIYAVLVNIPWFRQTAPSLATALAIALTITVTVALVAAWERRQNRLSISATPS